MTLSLYSTLARQKEAFDPIDPDHVKMYVCGPTVYDRAHIGNARPVVVFDVLFRLLRHLYPRVTYVRNITDVDDKIMERAREMNISIEKLTEEMACYYQQDMAALGALEPTESPRATHHIKDMQAMIVGLLKKDVAYESQGHVLFDVAKHSGYGKLSGLSTEDRIVGARVEVAPYKKNPQDFVLWKPSRSDQVGWESPWGRGRPGWHIECSAMAKHHLGVTFDVHGGGIDLVFPHHDNEIAQSECSHDGQPLARVWMHNGHLIVNGEKMSKSLGNFLTVQQVLQELPGEVVRLTLLSAHYRQPLDWTKEMVHQNKNVLDRFYGALQDFQDTHVDLEDVPLDVLKALCDDLNIPEALSVLHRHVGYVHQASHGDEKQKFQKQLKAGGQLMGLLTMSAEEWFQGGSSFQISTEDIERLIEERVSARAKKDFEKGDRIRTKLETMGILLEDTPKGTLWKKRVTL